MQAKEIKINQFLSSQGTKFIIPVYQRNYDWKQKQCQQLLSDIENINPKLGYFIGSVVHKSKSNLTEIRELVIIDGQQRLTTLTLFLYVISEVFQKNNDRQFQQILDYYIFNKYDTSSVKLKLKLIDSDFKTLDDLINNNSTKEPDGNRLLENYLYFREKIDSHELAKKLYYNFGQLMIVEIALDEKDNPQKIFQSLNSTGLELSQADLIRNYILMDLDYNLQENIYKNYWSIIESNCKDKNTNESKMSFFFRDFLTFKFNKIPSYNKVFDEFKSRYPSNSSDIEDLKLSLEEIKRFSSNYNKFINYGKVTDLEIKAELRNIDMIEVSVCYPFLLGIFDDFENNKILKLELLEILKLIQSFVFRRFICNLPTNALNKIFMTFWANAWKLKNKYPSISLYQATAKILCDYGNTMQFPKNEEVKKNLQIRDIYKSQSKNKQYLFEMLENNYSKFIENKIDITKNKSLSIEHIFPQNPSDLWRSEINSDEEYENLKVLSNTLGNLTIVINNSSLSNKSFIQKRDMNTELSKGYRYSKYHLNETLINLEGWNLNELNNRSNLLIEKFIEIWAYPQLQIDLDNTEQELDILDIENPTFLKPEYILLNENKINVSSNIGVIIEVLKNIHNSEPEALFIPIIKDSFGITRDIATLRKPTKIADGIYAESNYSSKELYSRIKICIENCDYTIDLRIKFKSTDTNQD